MDQQIQNTQEKKETGVDYKSTIKVLTGLAMLIFSISVLFSNIDSKYKFFYAAGIWVALGVYNIIQDLISLHYFKIEKKYNNRT